MEVTSECPYCGEDMEKGFIIAPYGIVWENKEPGFWWTHFRKKFLVIGPLGGKGVRPSFRCHHCEIVLFSTKKEEFIFCGTKCPHCGAIYNYSDDMIDENNNVTCQNCAKSFLLDQDTHDVLHKHEL